MLALKRTVVRIYVLASVSDSQRGGPQGGTQCVVRGLV